MTFSLLSLWCDGCRQDGFIYVNDTDDPIFVLCQNCQEETAQVWCSNCQMGGQLFDNVKERPNEWACSDCKSVYTLPDDFYSHITYLEVPNLNKPKKNSKNKKPFIKNATVITSSDRTIYLTRKDFFVVGIYLFLALIGLIMFSQSLSTVEFISVWIGLAIFAFGLRAARIL